MERIRPIFIVGILIAATMLRLLTDIGRPATRWDEQTNISVIRDTISANRFPVMYHGDRAFFEKPPLWYFLNIIPAKLFGAIPIPMRAISILSGMFIVGLSVWIVHRSYGNIPALITWIVLIFSHHLFTKDAGGMFSSHTLNSADADALQILFILIAFAVLFRQRRFSPVIAGIATGLAALTKGPLGFLPLTVALFMRPAFNSFSFRTAWVVAFTVIVPWYLAMILTFGEIFVTNHIQYHIVSRITETIERHGGAPWYYLAILINPEVYPVFPLVAAAIAVWVQKFRSLPSLERYAGVLTLLFILIPSLMRTKLAWYILPAYPFLAIFTGMSLSYILKKQVRKRR